MIRVPCRPPYDWASVLAFLSQRAIAGVEEAGDGYRRTTRTGTVHIRFDPAGPALLVDATGDVPDTLARIHRVFDPAGDAVVAALAHLSGDPVLGPIVAIRPGLRIPGNWDGWEGAVRAVMGQQVTIAGARALSGQLAALCAQPSHDPALPWRFPDAPAVAATALDALRMPGARRRTLHAVAAAVMSDPDLLDTFSGPGHAARLLHVPGIGPWSAQYILLRALRDPDAFPASDVGLLRALAIDGVRPNADALLARAEAWRPHRSYAAQLLWSVGR